MIKSGRVGRGGGGEATKTPQRVVFNFTSRCNMACKFCYIPWDRQPLDREVALQVVDRVASWRPRWLTFGGGDPLTVHWLEDLLAAAREQSPDTAIQLDTNGLKLTSTRLGRLAPQLDLLGLPLDGITESLSGAMRSHPTHARRMLELLPRAVAAVPVVKINTVVSRINVGDLIPIGAEIARHGVRMWSLYEFWEIGDWARENAANFRLEHSLYMAAAQEARRRYPQLLVEHAGDVSRRKDAYFFVTPNGRAYTVDRNDPSSNVELGNVLLDESAVMERWLVHADPVSNEERITARHAEVQATKTPAARITPPAAAPASGDPQGSMTL